MLRVLLSAGGSFKKFQLAAIDHMQPSLVKRVQAAALSWVSSSDSALKLVTFWERAGGTRPHAELRQCPPATEFDTHHAQEGKLAPATSKIHQAAWPAGSCSRQPGRLYSGRLTDCTWAPASPAHRLQVTAIRTFLRQAAWQTSLGVLPCFNHSLQLITSISISCQRQPGLQPWQAQG